MFLACLRDKLLKATKLLFVSLNNLKKKHEIFIKFQLFLRR